MNPDENRCLTRLEGRRCALDAGHRGEHAYVRVRCWCCRREHGTCGCKYSGFGLGLRCDVHPSWWRRLLARLASL